MALEQEFCRENGFEVIGSIASSADAELFCFKFNPDLMITDVSTVGGASGLEAAAIIHEKYPGIRIIVTSGFDEVAYAPRARELGAHAFVYKSKSLAYYREVADRVLNGEIVFPEPRAIPAPHEEKPFDDQRIEILRLMYGHKTGKEIAQILCIGEEVVKQHIADMLNETGLDNAIDLMFKAVAEGWIDPRS